MSILKGSVREVLQRIVRNSGHKIPGQYRDDMLEWIPEGIEEIGGFPDNKFIRCSTPIATHVDALFTENHAVDLPCGLVDIIAVEDAQGFRVRIGSDETDIKIQSTRYHSDSGNNPVGSVRATNFQMDVFEIEGGISDAVTDTSVAWDGSDITQKALGNLISYYIIQGATLQTAEENAFVRIHYWARPTDEDGFYLFPDNGDYKSALYWYVMKMLIGAGYEDKIFKGLQGVNYCDEQFQHYAALALGDIRSPNVDKLERLRTSFSERMIPPRYAYDDFFVGQEQIQPIVGI
jgi:hypothetical protein